MYRAANIVPYIFWGFEIYAAKFCYVNFYIVEFFVLKFYSVEFASRNFTA